MRKIIFDNLIIFAGNSRFFFFMTWKWNGRENDKKSIKRVGQCNNCVVYVVNLFADG